MSANCGRPKDRGSSPPREDIRKKVRADQTHTKGLRIPTSKTNPGEGRGTDIFQGERSSEGKCWEGTMSAGKAVADLVCQHAYSVMA